MERQSLLSAYDVTYEFAVGKTLFSGINAGINQGDKIALIGANGIGKSTLLKYWRVKSRRVLVRWLVIAHLLFAPNQYDCRENKDITVLDLSTLCQKNGGKSLAVLETRLDTKIDLSIPIGSLSGGEITKLFLAIGLCREPNVLLLDEPTNHMDFLL
jgi:ATPase subunit of ABC transporter with duplicated ATPase domains